MNKHPVSFACDILEDLDLESKVKDLDLDLKSEDLELGLWITGTSIVVKFQLYL